MLDVLAVRCHKHNISHSGGELCPSCERERSERYAAEQLERERVATAQRHAAVLGGLLRCGCSSCEQPGSAAPELPPVLVPPMTEARLVDAAIERLSPDVLAQLLGDAMLLQIARKSGTRLHRFAINIAPIPAGVTMRHPIEVSEVARLVRMDFAADQAGALERVRVHAIHVGARTIGEGGTLAQLNRCPLARELMVPGVGALLVIENCSTDTVTIRGVVVCEIVSPRAPSEQDHLLELLGL